jgi:hypothetical protein
MAVVIPNLKAIEINIIKELLSIWEPYLSQLSLTDVVVDRLIFVNSVPKPKAKGIFVSPEGLARLFLGDKAEDGIKSRLKELLFKALKDTKLYRRVTPDVPAGVTDVEKDQQVRHKSVRNFDVHFCNIVIFNSF